MTVFCNASARLPAGVVPAEARAGACLAGFFEEVFAYPLDDIGFLVLEAHVSMAHFPAGHAGVRSRHPPDADLPAHVVKGVPNGTPR